MAKYEAPRAVRLTDSATAQFACENGPSGHGCVCDTGAAVNQNNCLTGQFVTPKVK